MERLQDLQILVTGSEAYPTLETAVLDARHRIDMGFRVFDPRTDLVSDAAREIGGTWIDLLVHKLDQGVSVKITLTDFDPVVRARMHYATWKSYRILRGIAEMTCNPHLMHARVAAHPARVGWAPRIMLWTKVLGQVQDTCDWIDGFQGPMRRDILRSMPLFSPLAEERDGKMHPVRQQFPPMMPVTHHQKLAVIDDEILYIGGLDLDRRRFDTLNHRAPAAQTWHDVQVMLRDPRRASAARLHLDRFQRECSGEISVRPPSGLLRTLSVKRRSEGAHLSPVISDTGILDAHLDRISRAQKLIYLESQFFRDPVLAEALADRAAEAPGLALIVMLPCAPEEVAFDGEEGLDQQYGEYLQAKCLRQVRAAYGARMFVGSPGQLTDASGAGRDVICGAPMIFIHSKVSVFDDFGGLVTSANINGRSMRWDTEIGIEITHPDQVRHLRARVMTAWLPKDAEAAFTAPQLETVTLWRQLARTNAAKAPHARRGFVLPHSLRAAKDFGSALPGVPVEMV